jgi:hypothetical protein
MMFIKRNVTMALHQIKHLRGLAIGIAALVFCAALLAAQTAPEVKIVVTGDVPTPLTLSASDLAAMPHERIELNEEDAGVTAYEGIPIQEIFKKAGLRGRMLAGYVLAHARDGYEVVYSMGELDPEIGSTRLYIADKREGKPLFAYQGPVRLIATTDKKEARSARMLERLEIVRLKK